MNKKLKVVSKIHRKKKKQGKLKARMQKKQAEEKKAPAAVVKTEEPKTPMTAGHEPVVSPVEPPDQMK